MLRFYWEHGLREHWPWLIVIVALAMLAPFFQVANIGLAIPVVTLLMGGPENLHGLNLPLPQPYLDELTALSKLQLLAGLMAAMALLLLVKNSLTILQSYLTVRLLTFVRFSVTRSLLSQYLQARYARQVEQQAGSVLHQMWDPPAQVAETVRAGSELLGGVLQFLALIALMIWISWPMTLLTTVLVTAAVVVFDRLFRKPLRSISDENYRIMNRASAFLSDAIVGIRQIKAHVAESQVLDRFDRFVQDVNRLDARFERLRYWPAPLNELFLVGLMTVLVVVTTVFSEFRMDLSYLVAFMLAVVRLGPSVNAITEARVKLHTASKSLEISKVFGQVWTEEENAGRQSPPARINALVFNKVSFAYPGRPGRTVLRDVTVAFRAGEITALVGRSGAGKSTIADLIVRLFSPQAGTIEADGVDIREFELAAWRRQIGFVGQDTFLFNASIRDNIALADPRAPFEAVVAAARLAHIHEFIEALPEGYATVVGDRGMRLSGGQRQRLAIARALLTGPRILVFDEATSALDAVSERAIHETVNELRAGRIVVVIAHRLSTIVHAQKIVVLEHGCIIEEGGHAELMAQGAAYARLYSPPSG